MAPGDLFVLVSDGICDNGDDDWLCNLLQNHAADSPKELAARLVVAAAERGSQDDLTAIVCRMERRPTAH